MKGKKIDAKAKVKDAKEKSKRQRERFKREDENRAAAKEKSKDAKKVAKAKEKAKSAGAELSDRIKKTQTYTSGMSQSTKTASSTGQGTGASDALGAAISNAGSAVKSVGSMALATQSLIKQRNAKKKAERAEKKAEKKQKKFDKKYNESVFYDWREEFLHEVEKKGNKKDKKIIDVMRGKNVVEINPVTEEKKDYCDCGCDCGKKICEECGKPHRPENIKEDMKGMSQKSGDKRSTESGAGMTAKGVAKYNRRTGGNLKTAVTTPPSKLDPDSKAAKRRKSFCARSRGWTGERGKAARRRWNC